MNEDIILLKEPVNPFLLDYEHYEMLKNVFWADSCNGYGPWHIYDPFLVKLLCMRITMRDVVYEMRHTP
jgi:hypothetical protein